MIEEKNLTIVIVTFKSESVIKTCLENIDFNKYGVFVVDNNSSDNTVKIIEDQFPKVNLIKLEQNIGYGRANNIALKKTKTPYALILNPDAFIKNEDIEACLKAVNSNNKIALLNPKNLSQDNYLKAEKNKSFIKPSLDYVGCVSGDVMFMNMDVFRKIGFFDENIFMFTEDNELCQRAIDFGYKNAIFIGAIACHLGGGSSGKSLRITYRRFWHLGWSKSYYRKRRKSFFNSKRATLRLAIVYFLEAITYLIRANKEKFVSKIAFSSGCFASFIGLGAFDKNGKARG